MSDDDHLVEAAYAIWRVDMWLDGFGDYQDIEWAVRWRLIRPFRKPGRIRKKIARALIKLHKAKDGPMK